MSDFEESEYRGPLFNQLERGSHLLWEPGQVFEKSIGIDRASYCLNNFLWSLYGVNPYPAGTILRNRSFSYIWSHGKHGKQLPDFSLNLFIQAKRATYSSQSNTNLNPHITGPYWYFEITDHQQVALENLENELGNDGLVIYASPVFHKQQELYNHTVNQTIVENSTFPKASMLKGHSKWYYNTAGIIGVANPDYENFSEKGLAEIISIKRKEKGDFNSNQNNKNLIKISSSVLNVVEKQSSDFRATQFAEINNSIDDYIEYWDADGVEGLKEIMQINAFNYLWKLQWLTF
jgi:hypothetical protein